MAPLPCKVWSFRRANTPPIDLIERSVHSVEHSIEHGIERLVSRRHIEQSLLSPLSPLPL